MARMGWSTQRHMCPRSHFGLSERPEALVFGVLALGLLESLMRVPRAAAYASGLLSFTGLLLEVAWQGIKTQVCPRLPE